MFTLLIMAFKHMKHVNRDSSAGYGPDDAGSIPGWSTAYCLHHPVQTSSGTHLASYLVDTGDPFLRKKWPER